MSLFKARDWWQTQCGHGEEFDMHCLLVANIDNDPTGQVKILTGSFSSFLRVYLPRERGYKAEDLLLETELEGGPVLALAAGRFTGSGGLQLAVLHPRKLSVYSVVSQGAGSFLQLTRLYDHWLEHTAANMTYGPFNGVQGCDYICVQSYDGQLYFFEAEALAFTRYLPHFLVPGPLAYVDGSDTFVTCTAAMELEAYKYKVIAAASGEKATAPTKDLTSPPGATASSAAASSGTKRMQADWRVVLGEAAIDIRVGRFSQGLGPHQADIIVLGEHNLFVLSSAGQITFQKRLEYHPACCTTYPVPGAKTPGGTENLLVATHTRALLVYRATVLSWAARSDLQPVAVAVAESLPGGLRGGVVVLDDEGRLAVAYMGTEPLTNPVGFPEGKDLDYEAIAREHRQLAAVIREYGGGAGGGRLLEPPERLMMRAQIPQRLDAGRARSPPGGGAGEGLEDLSSLGSCTAGKRLTIRLYLALQGDVAAENLTLSITAPEPLTPVAPQICVPSVSCNPVDPTLALIAVATGTGLPASATALLVATYNTATGEPRSQRLELALPLCAFCTVVPPVKSAEFKVTLSTNRAPPPLGSLFEDMLAAAPPGVAQALTGSAASMSAGMALGLSTVGGGSTASVMSFQFFGGCGDVTILVSKAGGRYRIQSDVMEALWIIAGELASRLTRYYAEAEAGLPPPPEGPFAVSYEDALPLDDFFEVVEQHFAARQRVSGLRIALEDRAVQFRNIEKRLLMRFKDKNPAPLNQLDVLMNETYEGIMELGAVAEAAQAELAARGRRLAGCVQLLLLLVRWRFALNEAEFSVLRACIPPEVIDGSEIGWEETTEAAMTHLLRTCLAKSAKEQAVQVTPLAPAKDTQRLRKHISLVLERMARGMRLLAPGEAASGSGAPALGGPRPLYRDYSLADVPHAVPVAPPPTVAVPGLAILSEEDGGGAAAAAAVPSVMARGGNGGGAHVQMEVSGGFGAMGPGEVSYGTTSLVVGGGAFGATSPGHGDGGGGMYGGGSGAGGDGDAGAVGGMLGPVSSGVSEVAEAGYEG